MQPTIEKQITTTGSLPGKVTKMGVREEDMQHVMQILTSVYSDSIMAVLREISANARDSHVMAGKANVPIEVLLPNRLNTNLRIRDYGLGMSVEFVEEHYAMYGNSDKRATLDGIGGFGIGGKSPLAYTDSFMLTTVKDHEKGVFEIFRDKSGAGSVRTVLVVATDEDNMTEVSVPAKNVNDFDSKAEFLFKFWPEGTVLVNGKAPRRHEGIKVTDTISYSPAGGQSYVTMGGIPYRVQAPQNYMNAGVANFAFIAEIPINSADITPDREDLEYTDKTKETLRKVGKDFADGFLDMVKKEILDMPTGPEAYNKWISWKQRLGYYGGDLLNEMTYKGVKFSEPILVEGVEWRRSAYRGKDQKFSSLSVETLRQATFITESPGLSSYVKSRIRAYQKEKSHYGSNFHFVDKVPESIFVDNPSIKVITWNEIKAVRPPRAAVAGMVTIYDDNGMETQVDRDEFKDWEGPLLLLKPADTRKKRVSMPKIVKHLTANGFTGTIVKLPENRQAKFRRDFKDVEDFIVYVKSFVQLQSAGISQHVWKRDSLSDETSYILRKIDKADVDDPVIKDLIDLVDNKNAGTELVKVRNLVQALHPLVHVTLNSNAEKDYLRATYPLVKTMNYWNMEYPHLYIYLNAAYAARKDK